MFTVISYYIRSRVVENDPKKLESMGPTCQRLRRSSDVYWRLSTIMMELFGVCCANRIVRPSREDERFETHGRGCSGS